MSETGSGESTGSPNTPVSSEGNVEGSVSKAIISGVQVAESFDGELEKGELERLPGFDPQRALKEGMSTVTSLTESQEFREWKPAGPIVKSVCALDDRVEVMNTTALPWRWICKLFITFPDNAKFIGTGWFIGPKTVMTAGHCVYSKANGGWATQIEVVPGIRGTERPYGSMVGTSFRSVTGWTEDSDQNYDYGCIILPSPDLGNQVGYFGFAALTDDSLKELLVNNSGYPGDKPPGTQWFNAGRVTETTPLKVFYMLDTYGGQSGCPTWRLQGDQRQAIGIHAYGGCPNSSTRIDAEVYNNMMNWRNV